MYPLKFEPILKERLWGGSKLKDVLGKNSPHDKVGESWEISTVKGAISVVINGAFKGMNFQDIINKNPINVLGENVVKRFGKKFPILIKFIDAKLDLSIQLHPDDELAKKRHNSLGKKEMWYIMDAPKKANLIIGFNKTIRKEEYQRSLKENTLLDLLNYESVKEGDAFFINTGKIHAIGAGVLLAEIQQTSDITYRVFDFNRKDKNDKLRELHSDMALDALDFKRKDDFIISYSKTKNELNKMVACPYFNTNYIYLNKDCQINLSERDSFTIYICVFGSATVETEYGNILLKKGETTLIAAQNKFVSFKTSEIKLLEVSL